MPGAAASVGLFLQLDDAALGRKLDAADAYPELAGEVRAALGRFGTEPFRAECLRPVAPAERDGWAADEIPFYERYGEEPRGRRRVPSTCCASASTCSPSPTRSGRTASAVRDPGALRVLITNRTLASRTGTELYVRDLPRRC